MKILQIVKTSEGARWAFDQIEALNRRDIEMITVLPNSSGRVAQMYAEQGFKIIEADLSLPLGSPWKIFSRINTFKKIVKEVAPDIIHCHFVTNVLLSRIALRGINIPRIFQVPGPLHLESTFYRKMEIGMSQKNDYWIGSCKKTCEIYRESGIDVERLFLGYYGGYGGKACDVYLQQGDKLHREYGISDGVFMVGMVSYFYKPKKYASQKRGIKGHEDFIDAIALVREKYPNTLGVIIGGPWGNAENYVEQIKQYAENNCKDGIIFTGFRTDIKDIYCELDVAVHPSHSENLGGAAESLAAGRPTVSTNVGGFPDIVVDGETGYTVPKESPKELAHAIIKMLEDPQKAQTMGKNGRDLVRDLLDIENCADKIKDIYIEILNNRTGR